MKHIKYGLFVLLIIPVFLISQSGQWVTTSNSGWKKIGNIISLINGSDKVGIGTSSPQEELHVVGEIFLVHTATGTDEHALEIDVNAAGFGDVKALDIVYSTGDLSETEDEAVVLINIDEFLATGGDVSALEVLSTEGSATVYGLKVGAVVNPIIQLSGTFVAAGSIADNGVDVLAALSIGGAGNIAVFTADNDSIVIGASAKFEEIEFIYGTVSSGQGITPTFEFSTGNHAWTTFTPVDGTNGARNNGVVAWEDGDIPAWATGIGSEFLIRIIRTRNGLATTPILDSLRIVSGANIYTWDKDGKVSIAQLVVVDNDTMEYGGIQTAAFVSANNQDATWFDPGGDTLFVKNNGTVRFILTTAYAGGGH